MKQTISSFSIIITCTCLSIIGAVFIPLLTIKLHPTPSTTNVSIYYQWSDASAKVIEQEVTSKIEGLTNELKNVQWINSYSYKGHGRVVVGFKTGIDMDAVRFEIANIIRQIYPELPEGVSYPEISKSSPGENNSPILTYSINAEETSYAIDKYARTNIMPKISLIEGVSKIQLYGASQFHWVVTYDVDRILKLKLSIGELQNAIRSFITTRDLGMGTIENQYASSDYDVPVRLVYMTDATFDWQQIPIKKVNDRILFLKDVATASFEEAPVTQYYRMNGLNTVNMVIFPERDVNTIKLSQKVRELMGFLKEEISNKYHLKLTRDSSSYLSKEITKIQRRTLFSLLILLILTILLYRNLKYIGILSICIFSTLLIAVIFYYVFDVELQLYSFAGITISFGILIDNSIIMLDHLLHKKDKKVFLAIFAATLTTVSAVAIIYFLEESQQKNLSDFAYVIIINLSVSLIVSYFFVPALVEKMKAKKQDKKISKDRKIGIIRFLRGYRSTLFFLKKRWAYGLMILVFVLGFGLPIHLLPTKYENPSGTFEKWYNKSMGSDIFLHTYRPVMEKVLGGSLRLFATDVFEKSFYSEPSETVLYIRGSMPVGGSVQQLNIAVKKMEAYLSTFDEIRMYETQITSYQNSSVAVYFKEKHENTAFPYVLKSLIETKANSLGGMDWDVYGVGKGFSNRLGNNLGNSSIVLEGYNYDKLYSYAQALGQQLVGESGGRVKEVKVVSERSWRSVINQEYYLDFDPQLLALYNISAYDVYRSLLSNLNASDLASVFYNEEYSKVKLVSNKLKDFTIWDLKNFPVFVGEKQLKLHQVANIEKRSTGNDIRRNNQQYYLEVTYDFIGSYQLSSAYRDQFVERFKEILPLGYRIYTNTYRGWDRKEKTQYYYIGLIIFVIFFICAILLESLKQPLAVISMIPISFIGVFLTFYFFEFNFDQGGYASFILLAGISVNSALYIINDFNNLKAQYPGVQRYVLYFKAFRYKIIPILLTIITTIAGLIPFVYDGQKEVFWFAFAVGSIGGLVFSLLGILIYLPLFCLKRKS